MSWPVRGKCLGTVAHVPLRGSVLARSHTFHRSPRLSPSLADEALDTSCVSVPFILRLKLKPLGFLVECYAILGAFDTRHVLCRRVRVAPCHPWHRDISPSLDKPNAFLHALSPALIDAIPLSVLTKPRNFLWFGSTGFGVRFGVCVLFAFIDANALCELSKMQFQLLYLISSFATD